ncbi:CHASE2 domain-containing protein [Chloroflexota bacterium]
MWLSDQLFISEPSSPNIVVVGIDDDTINNYGKWSNWSRSLHSQVIDNLSEAGAKVIGFDIIFSENSSDDEILATSMRNAGNIILPLVGTELEPSNNHEIVYAHILSPVSTLKRACINIGHANLYPDFDGTVRRVPLIIRDGSGQTHPAFSLSLLHAMLNISLPEQYSKQSGVLHLLDRNIPVDSNYRFRINFAPENTSRPYISYQDVINGNFDPLVVRNKIVLIGMTATGELDKWVVPTAISKVPGVFIHAVIIDTILRQQFLTEVNVGTNLIIMLLLGCISSFALPRLSVRWGSVMVGILFGGYLVAVFVMFENGYILNILYPLSILPVIHVSSIITQNTATTIENASLHRKVAVGYKSTIRALAASIDAKHQYTRGHSERVTEYVLLIASSLPMSQEELEVLEYAGILHDIGKIGIPDSILSKPGPLEPEEWTIVHQHPVIGANIIKDIPFLEEARRLVLHHHERYDGTGYPDGLMGNSIPLGARLLAVADTYDSLTSDRAYRTGISAEDALSELRNSCDTQLCPIAVKAFIFGLTEQL